MTPAEALHQAEACRARLEARQALRPLARKSAEAAARVAEDRFTAARLDAWAQFLSPTH